MARGGQHTCIDSSAKIVHHGERKFPKKEPTWSYQKRIGVSAGHPKIQQVSFTNCYMEDLQDPEPEMSCPLKRLHFPLLLQSRVNGAREREWRNQSHSLRVNEGGDREWRNRSQSHLWIPNGLLLKSSSGIEESETSLVSQPNTPHPLRPGLADLFVASVVIHTSCGIISKSYFLMVQHPSAINWQGVKPAKTSGSGPAQHHFQQHPVFTAFSVQLQMPILVCENFHGLLLGWCSHIPVHRHSDLGQTVPFALISSPRPNSVLSLLYTEHLQCWQ